MGNNGLSQKHQEDLAEKGFTPEQIAYLMEKDWTPKEIKGFSESQLQYMCSQEEFMQLFSQYFSNENMQELEIPGSMTEVSLWWMVYVRLLLANLKDFHHYIQETSQKLSLSSKMKVTQSVGNLSGQISVEHYCRQWGDPHFRGSYPCYTLEKTVNSPENIYFRYILEDITLKINKLIKILMEHHQHLSIEKEKLKEESAYLKKISKSRLISQIRLDTSGYTLEKTAITRMKNSSSPVKKAYLKLFTWYDIFRKNHGVDGHKNEKDLVHSLIYNEDQFADFLFKLWNLYSMMKEFRSNAHYTQIAQNPLRPDMKTPLYQMRHQENNSEVSLYFMVGEGLYWEATEENNSDLLRNTPDISVRYLPEQGKHGNITQIKIINEEREKISDFHSDCYEVEGVFRLSTSFLDNNTDLKYKNQGIVIGRKDSDPLYQSYLLPLEKFFVYTTAIPTFGEEFDHSLVKFPEIVQDTLDIQKAEGALQQVLWIVDQFKENNLLSEDPSQAEIDDFIRRFPSLDEIDSTLGIEATEVEVKKHFQSWDKLHQDVRKFSVHGEYLYQFLLKSSEDGHTSVDFTASTVSFYKALEKQWKVSLITPFREEFILPQFPENSKDFILNRYQEDEYSIGNFYYHFLKKKLQLPLPEKASPKVEIGEETIKDQKTKKFKHYNNKWYEFIKNKTTTDVDFYNEATKRIDRNKLSSLQQLALEVNDTRAPLQILAAARNHSAHTSIISHDFAKNSRDVIFGMGEEPNYFDRLFLKPDSNNN